ncbi:MAG: APC family permease [Acidimicrobiales bacterium]|jgi:amino acid transporter
MTTIEMSTESSLASTKRGGLRRFDMILFSVTAILLLSEVPVTAQLGQSVVLWTAVVIFFFFLPYGLITAELGSTYPDAGGIYSWVSRAFGRFWGTQVSWWYWVNVGIWLPSVYLMFSTLLGQIFGWHLGYWPSVLIAVVLIWLNFAINVIRLDTSKWVANVAAVITVTVMVVLFVSGVVFAVHHGSANAWNTGTLLPSWTTVGFLGVVVYNFLGFELMSSASQEMRDPKRDVPRTILTAGLLIGVLYLVSTVGMLLLRPLASIQTTTGLYTALKAGLGSSAVGHAFAFLLGLGALYCFFALLIPWTIGANRAAAEAAQRGDLPRAFGRLNPRFKTPVGAAALISTVGTVFTLGWGIIVAVTGQNSGVVTLFWNLFAFSSVVFLFCYLVMAAAFLKLRIKDPDAPRPYKVPGGKLGAGIVGGLVVAFVAAGIVFFVWNPSGPVDWSFIVQMLIGLVVVGIMGIVFARFSSPHDVESDINLAVESKSAEARGLLPDQQLLLEGSE